MKTRLTSLPSLCAQLAATFLLLAAGPLHADIDLDGNGVSDIWEIILHPKATDAEADLDGDGLNNRVERIAGTNPTDPSSTFKAPTLTFDSATQTLGISWPTVAGKRYQLQGRTDLKTGDWVDDGAPVVGTGAAIGVSRPAGGLSKMYRVQVSDVDTDGDEVSDWEEIAIGLNPNGPGSLPPGEGTPPPPPDPAPVVSIRPTLPSASEDGPVSGLFTLSRTGGNNAVMVGYSVSGTATPTADHNVRSGWASMGVGVNELVISVNPVQDSVLESTETATVTINWVLSISAGGPLSVPPGVPSKATVVISNKTEPTGTGLRAEYFDTASTTYSANFLSPVIIDRTDATVNNDWLQGTPNGNTALASADNYSVRWDGYLAPGVVAGSNTADYVFQVDANDKARVFLDTDGSGPGGLVQIVEHGWDGPATEGTFKQSGTYSLTVPAVPGDRYQMRVEFVETTGNATCRFQWKVGTANFANVPSTNVFTNNTGTTAGWVGTYYNGDFATLVATQTDSAITNGNNGIWGAGSPDAALIHRDTFAVRWSGQVQPQFSEDYTFVVAADDGCKLTINGQVQPLKTVPVASTSGSTYNYNRTTGNTVVTYTNLIVANGSFVVGETVRLDPSSGNLTHAGGSTYTYDGGTGLAVINYSNLTNITAGSLLVGETVELDPTSGSLTTLGLLPYPIVAATSTTFTVDFGTGIFDSDTAGTSTITVSDNRNGVITAVTPTTFTVNFGPGKYVDGSTGNVSVDIINKPLKDWSVTTNERYARIPVVGGVRYNIQLEYFENTSSAKCQLSWYSPSQPKQIIPTSRLYPFSATPGTQQQAHMTSATSAYAVTGGPFSHTISSSNGATVTLTNKPAWLTFSGGVLSGTPPANAAGSYQIIITTTSAAGTGASVLNLLVEAMPGYVVREYWDGVAGSAVADLVTEIEDGTPPSGSGNVTTLAGPTDFGDDYGARMRGYITATVTGNYYFWIAANNAAELWISNDDEPVNAIKRASVLTGNATPQTWNAEANQKSPWLAMEAGKKYYIQILHKAGTGSGDNLAVGWAKPGQSATAPSQVVPGSVLSPYVAPAPGSTPGTLYISTMLSQGGAITDGVGTSTLQLNEDETIATMRYAQSGLSGAITQQHIHVDPYLNKPSAIVFDIDTPVTPGDGLQGDGSYKWTILDVSPYSAAEIREIIKQGKAYINLHTALYPAGEIRGNYTLAAGSRTFTPPPDPPSWTTDHTTDAGAARFLTQATFGPNIADITALKGMASYEAWIDDQFNETNHPVSYQLPEVLRTENASASGGAFDETLTFNAWWWNSVAGGDQLRQRVAFALSEIHVVSAQGPLDNRAEALAYFYDRLAEDAFGNFRDILETTTLTPAMGRYLDMLGNDKPDQSVGRIPNENYAREIKQLFSIGLFRMWPDGTLILSSKDTPIDTYTQREIVGFAHVFTGWYYGYDGAYRTALNAPANWMRQMREVPARHYTGPKRILNNEVLPGVTTAGGQTVDPFATHNSTQYYDAAYQDLPAQELDAAHDQLFNHPNVGPFICRQLIQRLVTSHPSRDYLYRVVQKFENHGDVGQYGAQTRGSMKAVIKAILLDYEARSSNANNKPAYGKQREPLLRVAAAARAFRPTTWSGTYSQTDSTSTPRTITINTVPAGTPHKLVTGNTVFLNFTSSTPSGVEPWIGAYSATVVDADTITVQATSWMTGTYSQSANSNTVTLTIGSHWIQAGHQFYVDFITGTANGVVGLDETVQTVVTATAESGSGSTTFTFTDPGVAPGTARSGNVMVPRFSPGSYTTSSSGQAAPNDRRITLDTNNDHHLNVGDQVQLNFSTGNPLPTDLVVTVESIVDLNTYTVLAPSAGTNLGTSQGDNGVWQFPLVTQPLIRTGNVNNRGSTYNMGNTDSVIDQTPINAATVFNFYLPDYKFPGALASQGITTPEFQETAETSVIRQTNFLFEGIYYPTNNVGLASFKTGSNALVMDLSQWLGNATDAGLGAGDVTTEPWTDDTNVDKLIAKLSTLLLGNQLSAGAKAIIEAHVLSLTRGRQISSLGTNAAYTTVNTPIAHNLSNGNVVTLSGITGGTFTGSINGTHTISNVTTTSFRVPIPYTDSTGISVTNARVSTTIPYDSAGTAPDGDKRDRLNAVIHLILASPDYTIQR